MTNGVMRASISSLERVSSEHSKILLVSVLSGQVASSLFMSSKFENLCWNFSFQNILMDQNLLLEMHLE